jgi:hypothetical protein
MCHDHAAAAVAVEPKSVHSLTKQVYQLFEVAEGWRWRRIPVGQIFALNLVEVAFPEVANDLVELVSAISTWEVTATLPQEKQRTGIIILA